MRTVWPAAILTTRHMKDGVSRAGASLAEVVHDDPGTTRRQRQGLLAAEAVPSAGDDGDLATNPMSVIWSFPGADSLQHM